MSLLPLVLLVIFVTTTTIAAPLPLSQPVDIWEHGVLKKICKIPCNNGKEVYTLSPCPLGHVDAACR
ncbi:hypothetical protein EX30DRAFT_341830 [Ascodesmis nigricans]|uniref:Uncharacterized protein n=1 Tax=Ascodesmis nigricans TaxID=341454 RepID=A0A4S2MTW7_9PEZI|nr:hypothetical protein EX30DRAFT_341830 [Ascodesmis nigricans]